MAMLQCIPNQVANPIVTFLLGFVWPADTFRDLFDDIMS